MVVRVVVVVPLLPTVCAIPLCMRMRMCRAFPNPLAPDLSAALPHSPTHPLLLLLLEVLLLLLLLGIPIQLGWARSHARCRSGCGGKQVIALCQLVMDAGKLVQGFEH